MDKDEVAKTLADIGEQLESSGRRVSSSGYHVSELLRELEVELVPTLPGSAPTTPAVPSQVDLGSIARQIPTETEERPGFMGRFRLVREIGRGGMGRVYEAHDAELRRQVAVKCFVDPSRVSSHNLSRFVAEAQITAQLEHPNIVPVHDIGVTMEGQLYFVMRRVAGRSLRQVLKGQRQGDVELLREWSRHRLLGAFVQVCQAVAYAHDRGVIHRDLKPSNIMLGAFGEVLVVDWGIAKIVSQRSAEPVDRITLKRTEWGRPVGTPGYMSPEQLLGQQEDIDARSDVWSLGAILYELVTLQKAFQGIEEDITEQVLTGALIDPRQRDLNRGVPDELAEVIIKALDVDQEERYPNAAVLAQAVSAYLEGSKRRSAAEDHALEALALFRQYESLGKEQEYLRQQEKQQAARVPAWKPLEEKRELYDTKARIEEIQRERSETFADVVRGAERALEQDPTSPEARALLAQAYATRLIAAEEQRDRPSQQFYEERVRAYDDGALAEMLEGKGALILRTDPEGAEVYCQRYQQQGVLWSLGEATLLGTTPLEGVDLAMGSYLLTIRAAGCRDTRYPVHIGRCQLWSSGERPIPLFSNDDIGRGFVYVPRGPFIYGGDSEAPGAIPREEGWTPGYFMARLPITIEQYQQFINALHHFDPEQARSRAPRSGASTSAPLNPTASVSAISWDDASAFAEWWSSVDGRQFELPREQWWEKAARGVDGRCFPWGDVFDASLCKMRLSRQELPQPEPVGTFTTDVSVYGVGDVAGSMSEWCRDSSLDSATELHAVRGGSWDDHARHCRLAQRQELESWSAKPQIGFRLARLAEPEHMSTASGLKVS